MLAGQVVQAGQAVFELLQAVGVEVEIVADAFQAGAGFGQLDVGRFQQGHHLGQARFVGAQAGQFGADLVQGAAQGVAFVAGQPGQGRFAALQQAGRIGLAAVGGQQVVDGGGLQVFALEFVHLVLQPGHALAHVAGPGDVGQVAVNGGPALGQLAHAGQQRLVAAEGVQQGQLLAAVEQGLVFVLAVDLHQPAAQFGQLAQGGGAAVDPGARAAVGADDAAQLAAVLVVEFVLAQPGQGQGRVVQAELGGQFGPLGAVAHDAGVGAGAGQPHQGVHQQRLACAGFAGNHRHAGAEREFGGADDGKILEGEVGNHGPGDFA